MKPSYKKHFSTALLVPLALALTHCGGLGSSQPSVVYYPSNPSTNSGGGSTGGSSSSGSTNSGSTNNSSGNTGSSSGSGSGSSGGSSSSNNGGSSSGGGGISLGGGGSPSILLYPYETVFGAVCSSSQPTPGCTFSRQTGQRINVTNDPDYNKYGYGSQDLWYVEFDSYGNGRIYDDLGYYQYSSSASQFAGYISGTTVGVGNTGFFWEDVSNGTYWLGKNGVLYNAMQGESNYGQAINNKTSGTKTNTSFAALNSDANQLLIAKAADRLQKNYGFNRERSVAVASALNSWAVAAAERGVTTPQDMNKTFRAVFGVDFNEALSAIKDLQGGDLNSVKDLTNRSAAALGLKPDQAQKFVKDMYKRALSQYGYDASSINW